MRYSTPAAFDPAAARSLLHSRAILGKLDDLASCAGKNSHTITPRANHHWSKKSDLSGIESFRNISERSRFREPVSSYGKALSEHASQLNIASACNTWPKSVPDSESVSSGRGTSHYLLRFRGQKHAQNSRTCCTGIAFWNCRCSHPQPVVYAAPPTPPAFPETAQRGFHDGFDAASRDIAKGLPPNVDRHPRFRNPPVPPPTFEDYRHGFREGYQRAFRKGPTPPPQGH